MNGKVMLIESLIGIILFTLIMIPLTVKDPLGSVGDYPPAIRARCEELGLIEKRERRFSKKEYLRKGLAMVVMALLLALVMKKFNGAETFAQGFLSSFVLWLIVDWYDALIVDCLWFCHSKKVRIPGTEDMKAYQDYGFHLKQSCIGMALGLPVCLLVGLAVALF